MERYQNRSEAGKYLAQNLQAYQNQKDTIVLALPRGGVPVAYEVAKKLQLPLDVFLVRKLGLPQHEEMAMGAIAEGNIFILNEALIDHLQLSETDIQMVILKESEELERRLQRYRQGLPLPELKDKTIILVDDGIATGATIKAAIMSLHKHRLKELILAVPVASSESIHELEPTVEQVVCPLTPENFYAVGQWYLSFPQITDEEVLSLLNKAKKAAT